MKRRKKTKIGKTGCLFWLLILLILIIVFLYKGKGSFKETIGYFKALVNKNKIEEITKKEIKSNKVEKQNTKLKNVESMPKTTTPSIPKKIEKPSEITVPNNIKKTKEETKKVTPKIRMKTLSTSIYFIKIGINGSAKPYPIKRKVRYKDSPITMTINTLLNGPTPSERKKGIISFIPKGTRLLSATIKNGNLVLNFNDAIEENYSGRDAILLELSQILYTSFEFNTVKSVSILINGRRKQYLTGEGIPLKSKYIRSDLSNIWD